MKPLDPLPELLSILYAAPLEPENWQHFMDRTGELADTPYTVLISRDGRSSYAHNGGGEMTATHMQAYHAYYNQVDPYLDPVIRNPRIGLHRTDQVIPQRELRKLEFYNDFLSIGGVEYGTYCIFTGSRGCLETLSLWSLEETPAHAGALLKRLMPHLRTAFKLRRTLEREQERAERAESALDRLATAAFLLDATSRVLHQNSAALTLIMGREPVCIRHGRLELRNSTGLQPRFESLVLQAAQVAAGINADPGGVLSLSRPGRQSLQVRVLPLRTTGAFMPSTAPVLVLVADPETIQTHPAEILQALYGFSASEAAVANHLAAGLVPEQIAEIREVSVDTIRTQIKHLLAKSGVHRHADLIRLMLALPRTATVMPSDQ